MAAKCGSRRQRPRLLRNSGGGANATFVSDRGGYFLAWLRDGLGPDRAHTQCDDAAKFNAGARDAAKFDAGARLPGHSEFATRPGCSRKRAGRHPAQFGKSARWKFHGYHSNLSGSRNCRCDCKFPGRSNGHDFKPCSWFWYVSNVRELQPRFASVQSWNHHPVGVQQWCGAAQRHGSRRIGPQPSCRSAILPAAQCVLRPASGL